MRNWYTFTNKTPKSAEILIYGTIGDNFWNEDIIGAKKFITDLKSLGDIDDLSIRINSPGGSVFEGNAIFNALKVHKANITVTIDGVAASIASVIAMAGDTIIMPKNAMMMIHNPTGRVYGTSKDMVDMANVLDKLKGGLISSYKVKSSESEKSIGAMMDAETWFTAQEAVDKGFATQVSDSIDVKNNYDLSGFTNVPDCMKVVPKVTTPPVGNADKIKDTQMPITRESLASDNPGLVAMLLAEGAKQEQDRINAVDAQLLPGHEILIKNLKADGKTTGAEAAMAVVNAEKAKGAAALAVIKASAPPAIEPTVVVDPMVTEKSYNALLAEYRAAGDSTQVAIGKIIDHHKKAYQAMLDNANGGTK